MATPYHFTYLLLLRKKKIEGQEFVVRRIRISFIRASVLLGAHSIFRIHK